MGLTDDKSFHVTVKALVLDDQGRVLLLRERSGQWDLPGGRLEHGESFQACLERECLEEMGVACEVIDPLPIRAWSEPDKEGVWRLVLCFRVRLASREFVESEECVGYDFFARDRLAGVNVARQTAPLREHLP